MGWKLEARRDSSAFASLATQGTHTQTGRCPRNPDETVVPPNVPTRIRAQHQRKEEPTGDQGARDDRGCVNDSQRSPPCVRVCVLQLGARNSTSVLDTVLYVKRGTRFPVPTHPRPASASAVSPNDGPSGKNDKHRGKGEGGKKNRSRHRTERVCTFISRDIPHDSPLYTHATYFSPQLGAAVSPAEGRTQNCVN